MRRSKTDQDAHGELVAVAAGPAVRHLPADRPGRLAAPARNGTRTLFTALRHQHPAACEPISAEPASRIVTRCALAAGIAASHVTGHFLRSGHATSAATAGVSLDRIAAQTRDRQPRVLIEHDIRPLRVLAITTSRDLGL